MKIKIQTRSDQWNAEDLIGGPRTFTIAGVREGKAEQAYDISLVEGEGRVWRPPNTVVAVILHAWGDESDDWIGRRVTLYRDGSVKFGGAEAPGIRISHMSNIPGPLDALVMVSRGKRVHVKVQPLADAPAPAPQVDVATETDVAKLRAAWQAADADTRAAIQARVAELEGGE